MGSLQAPSKSNGGCCLQSQIPFLMSTEALKAVYESICCQFICLSEINDDDDDDDDVITCVPAL